MKATTDIFSRPKFGPYRRKRYNEVAISNPEYFEAVIRFIPEIYFNRFNLCLILMKGNYSLNDVFQIYKYNLLKKGNEDSVSSVENDDIPKIYPIGEMDILKEKIITNLKSKEFNIDLHRNYIIEFNKFDIDFISKFIGNHDKTKIDFEELETRLIEEIDDKENIYSIQLQMLDEMRKKLSDEKDPLKMQLHLGVIADESFLEMILDYCRIVGNRIEHLKSEKKNEEKIFSFGSWNCDICGGNASTGCQYFDITECPKFS